ISNKYFPTLHRIKDESILNYYSYLDALKLCNDEQKNILVKEATEINRIQTEYLEIAKNEAPYDVFICYKETDEDTKKTTEDVAYCTRLYEILTKSGYKVFFARETLQNKLSIDYEPYIFAALKSSKVMAVIGSKSEYFTATWVKNEWSRFLKLMEKDSNKQIFFACDDPEELPRAFSLKQAQLLSNPNAMEILAQNIINYLANVLKAGKNGRPGMIKKSSGPIDLNTPEGMLMRAKKHLSQKNYAAVYSNISDLLEMNPTMPEAYWIRLLADVRHNEENIVLAKVDLTANENYDKAITFASGELKEKYEQIKDRCLENIRLQKEFNARMDIVADEFGKTVESSTTYAKKNEIVKELEDLKKDYDNRLLSKIGGSKILQEISKKVVELDTVYKTILASMSSRSITEYRKFCAEHNLSNLVELDVASEKMKALRTKYTEENKALRSKYNISEEYYSLNEEIIRRKDEQERKEARMNVLEEAIHEFDGLPTTIGEKLMKQFLDD
ncbi:MAG: TIR domain-containing protein, partial [Lachnospiraceae bacterium]|nr:TIR domain-containing protein [Lachnospiraceae bacterium]